MALARHTHTQFLWTVCFKCEHSEFWLCILNVYMLMASCFIFAWRMNKDRESPGAWHPSTEAPAVFDPITLLLRLEQAGICWFRLSISLQVFSDSVFSSCFFVTHKMQHASGFERLAIVSCGKNNSRCSTVSYRKLHLLLRKSHLQKTCTTKAKGHSDSEKMILCIIFSREVIPVECYHADGKESNPEGQKRREKGKRWWASASWQRIVGTELEEIQKITPAQNLYVEILLKKMKSRSQKLMTYFPVSAPWETLHSEGLDEFLDFFVLIWFIFLWN